MVGASTEEEHALSYFQQRRKDAARLGTAMFLTESWLAAGFERSALLWPCFWLFDMVFQALCKLESQNRMEACLHWRCLESV